MSNLVDFHSHFFSFRFFEALAERSPRPGTPRERIRQVADEVGIQLPDTDPDRHLEHWIGEMDRYGVGHMVTFASVPEEADVVARCLHRSDGRLSGLCVLDPTARGASERASELLGMGFKGVLLFPALHHFRIDGQEAGAVFDVLQRESAVAMVHCGLLRIDLRDRFGLPRNHDLALANPLALIPAADAHPDVRFVIPHFGAGFLRETLMAGAQCENVYVDSSSSNGWMRTMPYATRLADVFERTLKVFGPERVLFGTDSSVLPRGWRQDVLTAQREAIGACGLDASDRQRIFSGNATEVLGLDQVRSPLAALL